MAEAILAFYEMNALTLSVSRQRRKTIHWIVQTIGFIVTFIGVMLEFIRREKYGSTHFTTAHSITGLIAGIFSLISLINGVVASKAYQLRYSIKPIYSKILHNLTGILCFVIGNFMLKWTMKMSSAVFHEELLLGTGYDTHHMSRLLFLFYCIVKQTSCVVRKRSSKASSWRLRSGKMS